MTSIINRSRMRWLAPVAVALLLVGGTATTRSILASAGSAGLPPRSPAELLADLQQAELGALSGTVVQTSDLGIPELPGLGGGGSSDLMSLVSGTHTLRVWYNGTDKARVALLGTYGESDVIKNGADLWIWSSEDNTATHRTLPTEHNTEADASGLDPSNLPKTPQEAADALLQALDPTTLVGSDGSTVVAGRSAYQLTLRPRATGGALISSVAVAIDGTEHVPLRVQVFAIGRADPVFEVAFSAVDFAAPDDAQFIFSPPSGVQVTEAVSDATTSESVPDPDGLHAKVVGSGWTSVLVGSGATAFPSTGPLATMLDSLPAVSGGWGSGHLFAGTVFSAVVTEDGRVAIGAVQPDLIYAALASP